MSHQYRPDRHIIILPSIQIDPTNCLQNSFFPIATISLAWNGLVWEYSYHRGALPTNNAGMLHKAHQVDNSSQEQQESGSHHGRLESIGEEGGNKQRSEDVPY